MREISSIDKGSSAKAGAAGAGGGTLLVLIANSFDDSNALKQWLTLAAPSLSIFLTAVWLWLQAKVANYVRGRELKAVISEARSTLEANLSNPNTSSDHKNELRRKLESLEMLVIDRHLKQVESLEIVTTEDLKKLGAGS